MIHLLTNKTANKVSKVWKQTTKPDHRHWLEFSGNTMQSNGRTMSSEGRWRFDRNAVNFRRPREMLAQSSRRWDAGGYSSWSNDLAASIDRNRRHIQCFYTTWLSSSASGRHSFTEIHRLSSVCSVNPFDSRKTTFLKKFLLRTRCSDNLPPGAVRQLVILTVYRKNYRPVSHAVSVMPIKMYKALNLPRPADGSTQKFRRRIRKIHKLNEMQSFHKFNRNLDAKLCRWL